MLDYAALSAGRARGRCLGGAVLAAVTATGCNSQALGAMRYIAAASTAFLTRHFPDGVTPSSLAHALSLVFNNKDELQARLVTNTSIRCVANG